MNGQKLTNIDIFSGYKNMCAVGMLAGSDGVAIILEKKKKKLKGRHFSSDAEVIAAAETWLDGQPSEFFLVAWNS